MSFDGQAEAEAILAKLRDNLVGGRVFDGIPDDAELETDALGRVKPFIVVLFGEPIPVRGDRSLLGEREQPHLLPTSVVCEAADDAAVRGTAAGVTNLMLDWRPTPTSSGLVAAGGYSFTKLDAESKPSRRVKTRQFTTVINL